jgi:hypothetical protein
MSDIAAESLKFGNGTRNYALMNLGESQNRLEQFFEKMILRMMWIV